MCELLCYIKDEQELTHWALEHAASKEAYIDKVTSHYGNDTEIISEFNMWYSHMRRKFDDHLHTNISGYQVVRNGEDNKTTPTTFHSVSYTHLTLTTNREV